MFALVFCVGFSTQCALVQLFRDERRCLEAREYMHAHHPLNAPSGTYLCREAGR